MLDCDGLPGQVMARSKALKIPFSADIDPHVIINSRAESRFGCCKY